MSPPVQPDLGDCHGAVKPRGPACVSGAVAAITNPLPAHRHRAPAAGSGRRGAAAPRACPLCGRRTQRFAAPAGDQSGGIMRATTGSVYKVYKVYKRNGWRASRADSGPVTGSPPGVSLRQAPRPGRRRMHDTAAGPGIPRLATARLATQAAHHLTAAMCHPGVPGATPQAATAVTRPPRRPRHRLQGRAAVSTLSCPGRSRRRGCWSGARSTTPGRSRSPSGCWLPDGPSLSWRATRGGSWRWPCS
jgi:hypothetical protein